MTLYESIVLCLSAHNHSIKEIVWVGNNEFSIPISDFVQLSKQIDDKLSSVYTNLAIDILIVGKNFWLERNKYADELDGFVNNIWVYMSFPDKPQKEKNVFGLSLEQMDIVHQQKLIKQNGDSGYPPAITLGLLTKLD